MVMQCPRCPLRFDLAPMLADHLQTDHGVGPEMTDHLQPPSRRPTSPAPREGAAQRDADVPDGRDRDDGSSA